MAHIKCRYKVAMCSYDMAPYLCNYWVFGRYPGVTYCEDHEVENRYQDENGVLHIDDCKYVWFDPREFEKTVKSYEVDGDYLTYGRNKIDLDAINYLEIDGRVLIDEGE